MSDAEKPATTLEVPSRIYLVAYPKVIFLYPTFFMSLVVGCYFSFMGDAVALDATSRMSVGLTSTFLAVFAINMVVFSFDFPRTTSLTVFFLLAALVLGGLLLIKFYPELFPVMTRIFKSFHPLGNSTFFHLISTILGLLFVAVFINSKFDYWEVRENELLHHHGFLSNLERYSAPSLRFSKEINDIFEYMLLGAGRLILHPSNEPRAIVLDNVLFITRKEDQLTRMLGALQVRIRPEKT